ncbi:MAG: Rho termination factor domain protein [Pirellulaceae bacterium]|nr:MAG: Rho termination factor domain protein [Pirellulaceae bacterium]
MARAAQLPSSAAELEKSTVRQLGVWAERLGLNGWRSLRKADLIKALMKRAAEHAADGTAKGSVVKATKTRANQSKTKSRSGSAVAKKSVANRAGRAQTTGPARRGQSAASSTKSRSAPRSTARRSVTTKKKASQSGTARTSRTKSTAGAVGRRSSRTRRVPNEEAAQKLQDLLASRERQMDLSASTTAATNAAESQPQVKDRIVLLVRDAYWLQATWDITRASVERARAAMAEAWHTARPVLRLYELEAGSTTSAAERVERDIEIHGSVRNWYIDVRNPPRKFRVEIGYLASTGRFYSLARSNAVTTPAPGITSSVDAHWADLAEDYERIYALSGGYADEQVSGALQEVFEERLRRPMGSASTSRFGVPTERLLAKERDFHLEIDVEAIIIGRTKPNAQVTISGEPVKVRDDGSFTVRMNVPDRRQVMPIVASTADGSEQRTIVLAIERNTKVMEPIVHEPTD